MAQSALVAFFFLVHTWLMDQLFSRTKEESIAPSSCSKASFFLSILRLVETQSRRPTSLLLLWLLLLLSRLFLHSFLSLFFVYVHQQKAKQTHTSFAERTHALDPPMPYSKDSSKEIYFIHTAMYTEPCAFSGQKAYLYLVHFGVRLISHKKE